MKFSLDMLKFRTLFLIFLIIYCIPFVILFLSYSKVSRHNEKYENMLNSNELGAIHEKFFPSRNIEQFICLTSMKYRVNGKHFLTVSGFDSSKDIDSIYYNLLADSHIYADFNHFNQMVLNFFDKHRSVIPSSYYSFDLMNENTFIKSIGNIFGFPISRLDQFLSILFNRKFKSPFEFILLQFVDTQVKVILLKLQNNDLVEFQELTTFDLAKDSSKVFSYFLHKTYSVLTKDDIIEINYRKLWNTEKENANS